MEIAPEHSEENSSLKIQGKLKAWPALLSLLIISWQQEEKQLVPDTDELVHHEILWRYLSKH